MLLYCLAQENTVHVGRDVPEMYQLGPDGGRNGYSLTTFAQVAFFEQPHKQEMFYLFMGWGTLAFDRNV